MTQSRTNGELISAAKHLAYEIKMLLHLAHELEHYSDQEDGKATPQEKIVHSNALLESFCIHARSLHHFLFKKPGDPGTHRNDVFAVDYISDWDRHTPDVITEWMKPINWRVAHLSYERLCVGEGDDKWPTGEIAQAFKDVLNNFWVNAPDDKLDSKAKECKLTVPKTRIEVGTYCSTASVRDVMVIGYAASVDPSLP